ncbi:DUF367 family protein [Caldiplasma sukawensis]
MKIFYIDLRQDDPKKSTMRKLEKFSLAKRILPDRVKNKLILKFSAEHYLTFKDREIIEKHGICVIDGSWNLGKLMDERRWKNERKIPPLVASNPVNYGKVSKLSSVEAITASLMITGFYREGIEIMEKFSWGHTFIETNENLIKDYEKCRDDSEITEVAEEYGLL